ncbi:unnamed protein product [Brassica rapa]|uniref:Uncharacterized protein n=1 Tax=Brassica campestris TaxID=3711 RepID=A0A8D9HIK9_BRACM|nr:unnamed protein product [Brassica rapa]
MTDLSSTLILNSKANSMQDLYILHEHTVAIEVRKEKKVYYTVAISIYAKQILSTRLLSL